MCKWFFCLSPRAASAFEFCSRKLRAIAMWSTSRNLIWTFQRLNLFIPLPTTVKVQAEKIPTRTYHYLDT